MNFEEQILQLEGDIRNLAQMAVPLCNKVTTIIERNIAEAEPIFRMLKGAEGVTVDFVEIPIHKAVPELSYKLLEGINKHGKPCSQLDVLANADPNTPIIGWNYTQIYARTVGTTVRKIIKIRRKINRTYEQLTSLVDVKLIREGADPDKAMLYTGKDGKIRECQLENGMMQAQRNLKSTYRNEGHLLTLARGISQGMPGDHYIATHASNMVTHNDIELYAIMKIGDRGEAK